MDKINLITIFITGLLTGGLSCMAVQGGLLTATLAQREEEILLERVKSKGERVKGSVLPILSFLTAKLIIHTLLGFLLGYLGNLFKLSLSLQVFLQFVVVVFMIGTAFNMLNIHPVFRYFTIQPPRFLARFIHKQSKRQDVFAPGLLGALTILIPCGATQAMMALAITTGQPLLGAAIMFSFVLGTSPIFFLLGYLTTKLGDVLHAKFTKIAAAVIIILALFNLNNVLALSGSKFTLESMLKSIDCTISICSSAKQNLNSEVVSASSASIIITEEGYSPNLLVVKRGTNVKLRLTNESGSGCTQAFTIPDLGIQKLVALGSTETITFTAPDKPGEIVFMCSSGVYRGVIRIM